MEFARVVYCKLPTNGKQLPAFPLKAMTGIEPPTSEVELNINKVNNLKSKDITSSGGTVYRNQNRLPGL